MSNDSNDDKWDEGLKAKERLFCLYYCCDVETFLNATGSYRKAYTKFNRRKNKVESPDDKACESCGSRMPNIITFTDTNGKLMALKPDVTLSIIKNTRDASPDVSKLCYDENVYRVLEEISSLAFFNPAEIITGEGKLKGRSLAALGDKARAIAQIQPGKYGTVITLVNRTKYLELLSRYLELVRPEQQVDVTLPVIELPSKAQTDDEWNEEDPNVH